MNWIDLRTTTALSPGLYETAIDSVSPVAKQLYGPKMEQGLWRWDGCAWTCQEFPRPQPHRKLDLFDWALPFDDKDPGLRATDSEPQQETTRSKTVRVRPMAGN